MAKKIIVARKKGSTVTLRKAVDEEPLEQEAATPATQRQATPAEPEIRIAEPPAVVGVPAEDVGAEEAAAQPAAPNVIRIAPPAARSRTLRVQPPAAPAEKGPQEFKFLCYWCGKKLAALEEAAGRTIRCPNCHNEFAVPQPAAAPTTPRQTELGLRYERPPLFMFHCVRCGQGLEAERNLAGSAIECPVCASQLTVPAAPDE